MNTSPPSVFAAVPASTPASTQTPSPVPAHRVLPFQRVSGRTLLWSVLTGMALVVPLLGLIHFIPLPAPSAASVAAKAARLAHPPAAWLLMLKALVLYPLVEECVYRGIILQLLRRYLPLWIALVPPTLIFGLSHWGSSPQNAAFALLVGLYLAWLAVRHRSLLPSIVCHAGVNLCAVFVLPYWQDPAAAESFFQPVILKLCAVSLVVLGLGLSQLRGELERSAPLAA